MAMNATEKCAILIVKGGKELLHFRVVRTLFYSLINNVINHQEWQVVKAAPNLLQ